jgi:hypothetical protein
MLYSALQRAETAYSQVYLYAYGCAVLYCAVQLLTNIKPLSKKTADAAPAVTATLSDAPSGDSPTAAPGTTKALKDMKVPEFGLFVREDGTVDWDGAIQSGREVAKFGKELWERINGQDPHAEDANNKQQLFGGGKERREKVDPPSVQVLA